MSAIERIGRLGRRVLATHRVPLHRGGTGLARSVVARHRPPLLDSATRLARVRGLQRRARPVEAAQVAGDSGLSDFALRWMFGDGDVGPMAGSGSPLPPAEGPPSFLPSPEEAAPMPAPPRLEHRKVEEFRPFRLSPTPPPLQREPAPDTPEAPEIGRASCRERV